MTKLHREGMILVAFTVKADFLADNPVIAGIVFLIGAGNGVIAPGVDLLAEREDLFGAYVGTQTAAFAGLAGNGQQGHGISPPSLGLKEIIRFPA